VKNKLVSLVLIVLFLNGCMTTEREIYHPKTHEILKTISFEVTENHSNYDDVPFELERNIRKLLHERYKIRVVSKNADIRIKLIFLNYRRGTLRQAGQSQTQSLNLAAELNLRDAEGNILSRSNFSRPEIFINDSPDDLKRAQSILLRRLADDLVVDLLEP
jgi:hypothetical protein